MIVTSDSTITKHQKRDIYTDIILDTWWTIDDERVTEEEALEARKMKESYRLPYDTKTRQQLPIPVEK